jgi:hypothetical protein
MSKLFTNRGFNVTGDMQWGADVHIMTDPSVTLFHLRTNTAKAWVDELVIDPTFAGNCLVVENRYVVPTFVAMEEAGLEVIIS